jgi:hypothetical protein
MIPRRRITPADADPDHWPSPRCVHKLPNRRERGGGARTLPRRVTAVPWSAGTSQKGFHPVHPNRRPDRRALAVALAILLVPVTAGAVSAAYGKPEITMYASVSGTPFVDVRVNRNPKQVVFGSCVYVLDSDAPTGCGWMLGSHISSHWTLVPSDLSVGDHTVTVTIDLTDHEQLTNSISFTVPAPPTGP